ETVRRCERLTKNGRFLRHFQLADGDVAQEPYKVVQTWLDLPYALRERRREHDGSDREEQSQHWHPQLSPQGCLASRVSVVGVKASQPVSLQLGQGGPERPLVVEWSKSPTTCSVVEDLELDVGRVQHRLNAEAAYEMTNERAPLGVQNVAQRETLCTCER